jgi:RNA polymerase sigma-70 factor (ECF subfamily)
MGFFRRKDYSDEQLVAGCLNNDRHAQELFFRRYFPKMLLLVQRYTEDQETAMTIVHNGFLKAFLRMETYRSEGLLAAWLSKIIRHAIADHFRYEKQVVIQLLHEEMDFPAQTDLHQPLYAQDILDLIQRLPNATREVFTLYALEGYTHPEIAARLNISEGTSKWHVATARQKLRELLHINDNWQLQTKGT